jgi:hypothetical protein
LALLCCGPRRGPSSSVPWSQNENRNYESALKKKYSSI